MTVTADTWSLHSPGRSRSPRDTFAPARSKGSFVVLTKLGTRIATDWSGSTPWNSPIQSRGNPVAEEAKVILDGVSTDRLGPSGVSARTQEQVLRFLRRVTTRHSTHVSIVPDDEGVAVLHWVAGRTSVQVDVSEQGPSYLWTRDARGNTRTTTRPAAIYHITESVLAQIAADVRAARPKWRERMRRS